ncbi:BsuPI-related putative proteinase inhibitor [Halobacillus shinanisalinarum]|uniref:Intracellular proteinase inhibitor BsuPI domain-containing protein n=1 Tax=Halobacillus shinanisalinarum TaxID=2932258 RepID=A0ABY4GVR2_9BACI|nr:BsuPI-related putative proteinase inhibitor [Halobacillus shinanisalinarum]UOQ92124.1 BsuPI-related putative proteinase inhibitor [Halobacillus shinanisalinarum]
MRMILLSVFLLLAVVLSACGDPQQQEGQPDKDNQQEDVEEKEEDGTQEKGNDDQGGSGGIVAGKLEPTLEVNGTQASFQIKNQTERVQELVLSGKASYTYFITNEGGKTVYEISKRKPQYEQKKPITLKQGEVIEYKLDIPGALQPGTYDITAVLHTMPEIKAKTSFTIE